MNKCIHNVKITVFAHYSEGIQEVREALKSFFPNIDFDDEKQQISIDEKQAEGDEHSDDIAILTVYTKKQRHAKDFINNLIKKMSKEDKKTLLDQAKSRLDFKKRFFIRLDKDELVKNNKYILSARGNCFHIKMNVACYPNTDEIAISVLRDIFG
jgi:RNA binding exosome subunit